MAGIGRLLRTVGPLRPVQWWGRIRRVALVLLDRHVPGWCAGSLQRAAEVTLEPGFSPAWPRLEPGPGQPTAEALLSGEIGFLGRSLRTTPRTLPWHDREQTLLWHYQLHSFEFMDALLEDGSPEALAWARTAARDWVARNPPPGRPAWDPYCLSRRMRRLVRLLSAQPDPALLPSLGAQAQALLQRLELDLQGNHLWENAVALSLAGTALQGPLAPTWERAGCALLEQVLDEQLLPGGGHAERSAMYHAILLGGLLELITARHAVGVPIRSAEQAARRMATWLRLVTGPGGRLPQLNDAVPGPAPTTASLLSAARAAGIDPGPPLDGAIELDGWVVCRDGGHHLVLDAAPIAMDEQPGHAHADTLAFEWTVAGRPVVVDPGAAGYADDPHRAWSRSTAAHGVVEVDGADSAEVWSTFRVGRRPRRVEVEEPRPVEVPCGRAWLLGGHHDGYAWRGVPHVRRTVLVWWVDEASSVIWVADRVQGAARELVSRLPLAPGIAWEPFSGRLTGGMLLPFGFDERAVEVGHYAESLGIWSRSHVASGRAAGAAPTGWVGAVGPSLALEAAEAEVLVLREGILIARLPRPERVEVPTIPGTPILRRDDRTGG